MLAKVRNWFVRQPLVIQVAVAFCAVFAAALLAAVLIRLGVAVKAFLLALLGGAAVAGGVASKRREARAAAVASVAAETVAETALAADSSRLQAADAVADAVGAETAADAAAGGKDAALSGWAETPNRKRPRLPLLLAAGLAAAAPAQVRAADCIPLTSKSTPPAGYGYWREGGSELWCACFSAAGQYHDASRLPGGCLTPPLLPLIAYTLEENAALWSDLDSAAVRLQVLQSSVNDARKERNLFASQLRACSGKLTETAAALERLAAAPVDEPPSRLVWFVGGFGSAVVVATGLLLLTR